MDDLKNKPAYLINPWKKIQTSVHPASSIFKLDCPIWNYDPNPKGLIADIFIEQQSQILALETQVEAMAKTLEAAESVERHIKLVYDGNLNKPTKE